MKSLGAFLALLLLSGCAADPAPTEQLRLTVETVEQARTIVGTVESSPDLQLAESKLAAARLELASENNRSARLLAEQAELDARVAEIRSMRLKTALQLEEVRKRTSATRQALEAAQ